MVIIGEEITQKCHIRQLNMKVVVNTGKSKSKLRRVRLIANNLNACIKHELTISSCQAFMDYIVLVQVLGFKSPITCLVAENLPNSAKKILQ